MRCKFVECFLSRRSLLLKLSFDCFGWHLDVYAKRDWIYDKNGLDAAASGFSHGALFAAELLTKLLLMLLLFIALNWWELLKFRLAPDYMGLKKNNS